MTDLAYDSTLENNICLYIDRLGLGSSLDRFLTGADTPVGAPRLSWILCAMQARGYKVFTNPRGYDLNIVGIRSSITKAGQFDDWLTVFWMESGKWVYHAYPGTTDPGSRYLTKPLKDVRHKGTAILKPGQYRICYKIGKHRDKYTALVQCGKVTVYRDNNRDDVLDTDGMQQTGKYGINIHRAHRREILLEVGAHSAGCQVFQDPRHFAEFMSFARRAARRYGNRFTYTLLEE